MTIIPTCNKAETCNNKGHDAADAVGYLHPNSQLPATSPSCLLCGVSRRFLALTFAATYSGAVGILKVEETCGGQILEFEHSGLVLDIWNE